MELTGRLTANAVVGTLKDQRQVVNFTLAINDYYKPKGASEGKQFTQFVRCSYWKSSAVATRLLKGAVVEISGRLFTTAFVGTDGEPKASLNAHCNSIKVHSTLSKKGNNNEQETAALTPLPEQAITAGATGQEEDDIPF